MNSRRQFLSVLPALGAPIVGSVLAPSPAAATDLLASTLRNAATSKSASELATDESFWSPMINAFSVDRTLINLNNGGVSPTPRVVLQALNEYIDAVNKAPHYALNQVFLPRIETVRADLARFFGCSAEELALTRNTSESLHIVQLGMPLNAGDEVIITTQDYPRMLNAWDQRARREGIIVKKVAYPAPLLKPEDYIERIQAAVTPRTRVIHISHVCFVTGEILPVREVCRWARTKGIETIVDGAHALAQFPFSYADVECDYYAASLHKWLYAPIGNGFLFVRREHIKKVYPLMAAPADKEDNIRKFEEVGTSQFALRAAVGEALAFNEAVGIDRKAARLQSLNRRWIDRLKRYSTVQFLTNVAREQSWHGLVLLNIEGADIGKTADYLLKKHRIIVAQIVYGGIRGIRITPNIYTRPSEIDLFADVMERIARGDVAEVKA